MSPVWLAEAGTPNQISLLGGREAADQPAVFAACGLFHFAHFTELNLEVVSQLAPNGFLDGWKPRAIKLRARQVAKLRYAGLFLIELHRIKPIENVVMHIECSQRDAPMAAADQKFLFASD